MRLRFRVVLPVTLGFAAAALMLWDLHNQRVVESMGMAWDTGAPIWPYETPYLFLSAINLPAFVLAAPFFFLPHLELAVVRYPTLLLVIVLWWWWAGTRIDFGILGRRHYRWPMVSAILLTFAAAGLLYAGARTAIEAVDRWFQYSGTDLLLLTTPAAWILWSFALLGATLLAAFRLLQRRFPAVTDQRPPTRIHVYGFGLTALVAVTTSLLGVASHERIDPDSCVASSESGCIHGTIANNEGRPIKGIRIEVLPADNRDDARWPSFRYEWTDSDGRYSVNGLEPGVYLVAIHHYHAPYANQPFASAFYPGVEIEAAAERVLVSPNSRAMLKQFRLQPLPLVTLSVEVVWPDGTRPRRSNLSFSNLRYPTQATIGGVAPQIDNGVGEFTLPEGFEYDARASVSCDLGNRIQSRESPVQQVSARRGELPKKLTFMIPGPPCKLWRP